MVKLDKRIVFGIAAVVIIAIAGVGAYLLTRPEPPPTEKLKVAAIYIDGLESSWNQVLDSALRGTEEDLNIEYTYSDWVSIPDAESVLESYVQDGYEVFFLHSWYPDATKAIGERYPQVTILGGGGGSELKYLYPPPEEAPPNIGHYDNWAEEGSYMAGMLAAKMSTTGKLGLIGLFPVGDENAMLNGYIMGAKDANPDIEISLLWIFDWANPAKQRESAIAFIEAGCDVIFATEVGAEGECEDRGVYMITTATDRYELAPEAILTSVLWNLTTTVKDVIEGHKTGTFEGKEYIYELAQGGISLAPYHSLEDEVPADVKQLIERVKTDILEGRLVIPHIDAPPEDYWPDL